MLRLAASRGGGPETRSGTVQSLKCCPCQQKRARLPSAAPGSIPSAAPGSIKEGGGQTKCCASIKGGGGPRNALGHRPEPQVLPLPAETSREAPKCCTWQHQEGAPETRSGTVQSLKCCPCQQKRAARLPSAAASRGGPRNALGYRQSLKCCPCQQKRAARLPSAAPGRGPETRSGMGAAPGSIKEGGGPNQVLRLAGGGPRNALGTA